MILSKARCSVSSHGDPARSSRNNRNAASDLTRFIELRDYTGAIVLLQFRRLEAKTTDKKTLEWLAYCHFHHGEHDKALDLYKELLELPDKDPMHHLYAAACLFYMGLYADAEESATRGPECPLQIRILFHVAHRNNDQRKLMTYHDKLGGNVEDQLSLASIHYMRGHYQEAADVYKSLLVENREWLALNVYIALCYYNLDYHDVSLSILNNYLEACNNFKLSNGKAAQADLRDLESACGGQVDNDLVRHNQVVFQVGEGALQVFPSLVNILPEARLNLVIYYLQNGQAQQAYENIKSLEPATPQEFIVKAVTLAAYGQEADLGELIKQAHQLFQLVGTSASECDTIPGRQCMASSFFLLKQFDDALIYLKSIKTYSVGQEDFLWNYAIAKAANHEYQEAEEILLMICSERYRTNYMYTAWLSHCFILNKKACLAWEHYLQMGPSEESFSLLLLIGNECYKTGQFLFAAKAFDALERMDECPDYWEGKRGACIGVFRQTIVAKEPKGSLLEVMALLRSSHHPQVELILRVMQKWTKENGLQF